MPTKYDACSRVEIEGREKPIWPRVGLTVTVKDDGKINIYDARTNQTYFCFERDRDRQQPAPARTTQPPAQGDFDEDIPF